MTNDCMGADLMAYIRLERSARQTLDFPLLSLPLNYIFLALI